ncbi:MAG: hypothetical protein ABIS18_10710, partial [Actinomycetota bacterium]
VPPTGEILEPRTGHGYLQGEDKGPRADNRTTVLGATTVRLRVEDNNEVVSVYVYAVDADGSTFAWCSPDVPQGMSSTEVSCTLDLKSPGPATLRALIFDGYTYRNVTVVERSVFIGPYFF